MGEARTNDLVTLTIEALLQPVQPNPWVLLHPVRPNPWAAHCLRRAELQAGLGNGIWPLLSGVWGRLDA